MGLEVVLWRAVAVFRVATLGYAILLLARRYPTYDRPILAWATVAAMAAWTVAATYLYADPRRRGWPLLITDMVVTLGCLLPTIWVVPVENLDRGASTLPMAWVAAPVLAWAISAGKRGGTVAALIVGAADLAIRGSVNSVTINATTLLLLAGFMVGYVVRLGFDAEARMQRAAEMEAATRERERLARDIHDSVLQVLALISRRGERLGGEAAELGRLAATQSETLRALVSVPTRPSEGGLTDLRERLGGFASPLVSLAFPAEPVLLREDVANGLAAAAGAALDNVKVHCGPSAQAWVLVEDEGTNVTVTIRDAGPGIPDGRLAEAAQAGRLGVAQSVEGRMRDLGGQAVITSRAGEGTEVELRIER